MPDSNLRFPKQNRVLSDQVIKRRITTYQKKPIRSHFSLAERRNLGNDLGVGRGNVRDGTLQAVRWLVLADQSKRVAQFKKGRWSSGFRQ